MTGKRILIGSPVCQKPEILKAFLTSLAKLKHTDFSVDYVFVDDNQETSSSEILKDFRREGSEILILPASPPGGYSCGEDSHHWSNALMFRVGEWKNRIIRYALDQKYDALFLVDSDLVIEPRLLEHLNCMKKSIISEIFWTSWHPGQPLEPNVWLFDEYDIAPRSPGEEISRETAQERKKQFLEQLKVPGVYEVGGLGACTLISRNALLQGVNFSYISNLTIHGEDRFFCIRAAVLGIRLYVDTKYPAYHIYRLSDLNSISHTVFKITEGITKDVPWAHAAWDKKKKIVLAMTVRNEEGRYLDRVIGGIGEAIDEAVILDDASSDRTVEICEALFKNVPHRLIRSETSMFSNEVELRKKLWNETLKAEPDWILCLDGDEVPEEGFWTHLRELAEDRKYDLYGFRLFDMWNETEYREDRNWNAHKSSRVFLLRYRPDFEYSWKDTPQHCGRFPANLEGFAKCDSKFRVKHFGWARLEDRKEKFERYRRLDPQAVYGVQKQYDSILDLHPHMVEWREGDCNQK